MSKKWQPFCLNIKGQYNKFYHEWLYRIVENYVENYRLGMGDYD